MAISLPGRTSLKPGFQQLPPLSVNGRNKVADPNRVLKLGIWAYFVLLIFEGALRKWFLPFLSTPLLVVRDPIALWLVITAFRRGLLPSNAYITGMIIIGVLGTITAILLGHGSIPVAIFGARILLFHFPLIFVIGSIFNREDVIKMGRVILWMAIPMAVLIGLQFYSPQSAWVNRGLGTDEDGAGFSGAMGYLRPPGTFSFTTGTTLFFGLVASYVFYFWFNSKLIHRLILIGATIALLASIPLSISRSLLFQVVLCVLFTVIIISRKPQYLGKLIIGSIVVIIALAALGEASFFQTSTEAFTDRFDNANEAEGGLEGVLIDRFLGGMIGALAMSGNLPFFGLGIGMGTNVGSMLLSGNTTFLIAEGEWGRMIGELGAIMGITVVLLRVGITIKMGLACFRRLASGDLLPWMLASSGLLLMLQGGWAQPTNLGFCILSGGLMIASFNQPQES